MTIDEIRDALAHVHHRSHEIHEIVCANTCGACMVIEDVKFRCEANAKLVAANEQLKNNLHFQREAVAELKRELARLEGEKSELVREKHRLLEANASFLRAERGPVGPPTSTENAKADEWAKDVLAKSGHPGFLALLDEMRQLHQKKASDYGTAGDPFANVRGSTAIGIDPAKGAWLRSLDKVQRINRHYSGHELACESIEDSLKDLAAYCLIQIALRREAACPAAK